MTQHGAYRDGSAALFAARDAILARRTVELGELPSSYRRIYARRFARIVAGTVGCATAAAMGVGSLAGVGTPALFCGVALALVVWVVCRGFGAAGLDERMREWLLVGPDPGADLDRLERETAVEVARRTLFSIERASVFLPLAALVLLVPLGSHFALWVVMTGAPGMFTPEILQFDYWIRASLLVVGHSHLMLVYFASRFARSIEQSSDELPTAIAQAGWSAYGRTLAWSPALSLAAALVLSPVFPFGLLAPLVVFVVVAITGMFVPFVFQHYATLVAHERS
jgi:hypothetical protein